MVRKFNFSNKPRVSIIIPYNMDRGFLNAAVGSAMLQRFLDIEIILSHSKHGTSYNINRGAEEAQGQWIKILAEDDILPNNALMVIEPYAEFDFIIADAYNFGDSQWECVFKGKMPTFKQLLKKNCIHGGAIIYKTDMFFDLGGFDEELITAEEYDFHLRMLKGNYMGVYVPKVIYNYRIHGGNKYIAWKKKDDEGRQEYINEKIRSKHIDSLPEGQGVSK